jgi:hypothetical protein
MRMRSLALAAVASLALPLVASAQDVGPRQVLSFQPLNAMLTVYSAEYERAASKSVSWGVGGTYWNVGDTGDEATYNSGDFKLRYYPGGSALYGFALGGSVGFSSVKGETAGVEETASGASLGVLLEYQWLMGAKKNFSLALGAGAKMLMVSEDDVSASDFTARYPTARVSVGWAF